MKRTFRIDAIRGVPDRWDSQYRGSYNTPDKAAIGAKLRALPDGFTAEQVDKIIGNSTWTAHKCDECGKNHDVLIHIGEEPDYETRWQHLCYSCLSKALTMLADVNHPAQ